MQQRLFSRSVLGGCISLLLVQAGAHAEKVHEILSGFVDIQEKRSDIIRQNLQDVKDIMAASTKNEQKAAIFDDDFDHITNVVGSALGGLTENGRTAAEGVNKYDLTLELSTLGAAQEGKEFYHYSRPFIVDKTIHNLVSAGDYSFPSGHTIFGTLSALYTAWIFPERYQQLMTRASEYGLHRIVNGVHYPLDVIGGRMVGEWSFVTNMKLADLKKMAQSVRAAMLKTCNGQTIAACANGGSGDVFGNYTKNKADWESRLTYSLPTVGAGDKPAVVPQGAEYLIMTRFPYLSTDQLREVLRTTELPSGVVLDNGEGWVRLDLYRAADGYGAFDHDITITMDAANAADDTQPGAGYNASDVWRNDIGGRGVLTKAGSGELTLTGHNTFAGIHVRDGTLRLTGINEYEKGVSVDDGGILALENGTLRTQGDVIAAPGSTLRFRGGALSSESGTLRIEGSTELVSSGEVSVAPGRKGVISGPISGPGGLVKSDLGTLALSGNNSYTGGTHVTGGRLDLWTSSAAGPGTIELDDETTLGYVNGITVLNPLLLNGAVNLSVDSGEATQAGSLSGNGSYALTGPGRLKITGDVSGFSGHMHISQTTAIVNSPLGGSISVNDGGTLVASGPLIATVDVGSGGTLKGSGSTGSVRVGSGGTVTGNSPGTLRVLGDLSLDKGSLYRWEIDPATGHSDLLSVSGKATLSGGQVLHTGEAGTYSPLATYTILTAGGGVSGQFDGVASNYTFLTPLLGYTPDSVTLRLVRNDVRFASVAQTFNQREVAQAAERFPVLGSLYGSLVTLNAPQMGAVLDKLSGEIHATSVTALAENSRFLRDAALDRVRQDHGNGLNVWVRPYKSDGTLSGGSSSARLLNGSASGVMVGVDGGTEDGLRAGVLVGSGSSSWSAGEGHVSSDDQLFSAYAGDRLGPVALRVGAGYSRHNLDTRRDVSFADFSEQERASTHASVMQVFGEAGYVIDGGPLTTEPYAAITAVRTQLHGLSEKGGEEAALDVSGQKHSVTFTTAGLRTSWSLTAGRVSVRPWADAAWRHMLSDGTPEQEMAFTDTGAGFRVRGAPLSTDAAVTSAGITLADTGKETSLTLGWSGIYGKNGRHENTGNLTLNIAF